MGRSQRHLREIRGVDSSGDTAAEAGDVPKPPPITGISPDTATITAAGASGRTIATMSSTGGTPGGYTYTTANAAGIAHVWAGAQLRTSADPAGTVGVHNMQITSTDIKGATKTEQLAVTLT
jgi:hypothetical protein